MILMTARTTVRLGAALALLALSVAPRDAAAASFALSIASVGSAVDVGGGNDVIASDADVIAGPGHLASAKTGLSNAGRLIGGAKAGTNGADQIARATAEVSDTWECPVDACVAPGDHFFAPMNANISFDGILDPLIAALVDGVEGTDASSLSVYLGYTFPAGTFVFAACYEQGNAFDRAESGCGTPLEAVFQGVDGTSRDLTNRLQLGVNALGQRTVAFNEVLAWIVAEAIFPDALFFSTDIRSNDSEVPHLLNFFDTFSIGQTSGDPDALFTSALGRTSAAAAVSEVPEPATGFLLLAGLLGVAANRRRNRRDRSC